MKIEVGKKYITRTGLEVRIYATDCGGTYSVHGAVQDGMESWSAHEWTENGRYRGNAIDSYYDLFCEPTDPKPRMLAYYYKGYGGLLLAKEDTAVEPDWVRAPWLDEPEEK